MYAKNSEWLLLHQVPPFQQGQPQPPSLGIPPSQPPPIVPSTNASPPTQWGGVPVVVGGGGEAAPVQHWFYLRPGERYWIPFSVVDSNQLEEALISSGRGQVQEVSTFYMFLCTLNITLTYTCTCTPTLCACIYRCWYQQMVVAMTSTSSTGLGRQSTG